MIRVISRVPTLFCSLNMLQRVEEQYTKLKTYRNELLHRSSKQKFIVVRDWGTFFFNLVLCPITDPNYKIKWTTYFYGLATLDYCLFTMITIYNYRTDYIKCFQAFCAFGVSLPVSILLNFTNFDYIQFSSF